MSATVDSRVVEMRFDNKHFEDNVSTTMSTLEKFKHALKLDGASRGLDEVSNSANRFNLSGLVNAADTVGLRFNAMYTMADQALRNIVNSAMNAGKKIVNALAIDPIKTGLQEYETQINAVQTILANTESKGTTLKDVNGALDELNTYADKTIYNFTEMTRNIGTFTAAGVDLDTSVNAIQGIANLAAVSGSTSQQASTAMYQLSQAMASGTVKLMDWNSVVNAGMGGQVFQDALKETAKVHGVNVDKMIKKHGSFRETLQEGWITTDILTETLSHFTMAAEEGSKEWEEFKKTLKDQGYSEEQANAILKMSNTATDAATKVKTATQLFDTLKETAQSGWTQTWEIIFGDFEDAKTLFSDLYGILAPILEASAKARNELLQGWADAGGRDDLIKSLYNIFDAIGSIVKPIKEAFNEIFPPATAKQLVNITKAIKEFTAKLTLSDSASDKLKRTFKGLFAVLDIIKKVFVAVVKSIAPLFGLVDDLGGGIFGVTAKIGDWLVSLNESIEKSGFFTTAVEKIHKAFEKIGKFLKPVVDGIREFANSIVESFSNISTKANERLEPLYTLGSFIKSVFVGIGKIVGKIFPFVASAATGIGNVVQDLMGKIADAIKNADYDAVFDIVNGGIIAAIGAFTAKFMKSGADLLDNAGGFIENINGILDGVGDALGAFTDSLKADTLKKIATAIGILAVSLLILAFIPSEKLTTSLVAITTLFGELMGSMAIFTKMGDMKGVTKLATAMISLAAAVFILSLGLKIMSTMSWEEMGVGLISMTVGIGALVGAVNLLPDKKVKNAAKAIKTMSTAILILAVGIKIMSTMSWEEMGIGLITMVVGLAALVAAVKLLPKDTAIRAAGMIALASAMVILAAALKIMATMSWDDIARSLVALAGSLGILAGAMALMKKAIPGAAAMMIIAPALIILAGALRILGGMSWESIAKGLVAIGGSLIILVAAVLLMKNAIPGAAAILIVAASLAILAPALMLLGSMSMAAIGKALLVLVGVLLIFGLAAFALAEVVPVMMSIAGSLALLGLACVLAGAGVIMIAAGLTALSAALAASGGSIVIFITSIISLIPFLIEQIGVALILLCEVIAGGSAAICDAVTVIILAVIDALIAAIPPLLEAVFILVSEILATLIKLVPVVVGGLYEFMIAVINTLAEKLPKVAQALINLVMSLLTAVVEAIKNIDPQILVEGLLAMEGLMLLMMALAAMAALTPAAMAGVVGMGLVILELAGVLAALGAIGQNPGLVWLVSEGGNFMQVVGTAIGQFLGGLAGGFAQGMSGALPQIGTDLSDFMTNAKPFFDGVKSIDSSSLDGVKSLVGIIGALTAIDILNGLTSWFTGGSSLTKFGEDIAAFAPNIKAYADTVAGIDGAAVVASATAAKALTEMTSTIPNEGGVAAWFAGENSISKFGTELVTLGIGLAAYSMAITNFNGEAVIASANAATALAEMTSHIPNEGGMVAWFTGENSISKFGTELVVLGTSLASYSNSIADFNGDAVIASAKAAQALVDMTSTIPNEGGMVAWFTGENSVASWGRQLVTLGTSLASYSTSIANFDADAVIASANAAKALVDMTSKIPNEGGMVAWFTGENSVATWGSQLKLLGDSMSTYSTSIAGFNAEAVVASANAASAIVDMTSKIPNEGGMVAWFTGENSVASFASNLQPLGEGMKAFSDAIDGIVPENVTAAANAAKALAQMAAVVPNEGGLVAWFTGENSVSSFADDLEPLGEGLKGFSDSVEGINATNITAAANAAKALAQMANTAPKDGGNMVSFGEKLVTFGSKLKSYFTSLNGVGKDMISKATSAVNSIKNVASGLNCSNFDSAAKSITNIVKSINELAMVKSDSAAGFAKTMQQLAATNVEDVIRAFDDAAPKLMKAGQSVVSKLAEGIGSAEPEAKSVSGTIVKTCLTTMIDLVDGFVAAGKDFGQGLVIGIDAKKPAVYKAAFALGQAAVQGEKDGQKSNSPSKATIQAGNWLGEGLVIGMEQMDRKVYYTGSDLGKTASGTISEAISKLSSDIYTDIDTQPTIRPILDLSDVRSGASAISGLLNARSIAVQSNIGAITSMMDSRGQNGDNSDVVSAINKLSKKMDNMGNTTYQVNGVTYDDGSNITTAVADLVRAARIERRV